MQSSRRAITQRRITPILALSLLFSVIRWSSAKPLLQEAQGTPTSCALPAETQQRIAQQQWKETLPGLQAFVAAHATCADAAYTLGHVLLHLNQPDASLRAFTQAAALRPPTSADFVGVASDYILQKSYPNALRWLQEAVKTIPVHAQAWYLLGRTQYNLDQNEAAVQSFQHSLAVLPEDARSEYNLGLAYERLQQPDLARDAYLTAIAWNKQKNVHDAQPYLDLGLLERGRNKPEEALPYLQQAAAFAPGNALVAQELGRTLYDLNRLDESVAALQRAITLAPATAQPHFFLGRALRKQGKLHEADEQFALVQTLTGGKSIGSTPNTDIAP